MKTTTPIRAILFDKDGTLIDYHQSWGPTNRRAAKIAAAGDTKLEARLLAIAGFDSATGLTSADSLFAAGNTEEIAHTWVKAGCSYPLTALTQALDELFQQSAKHAVPVSDLFALFKELNARGIAIGIASSDSETAIRLMLEVFGISDFVAFVAGYDSGYGWKPEPGMLLQFSAVVGIPTSEIAVVGDNLHDMAMAEAGGAGLRVGVLSGTGTLETLTPAADFCLPSIASLNLDQLVSRP
ncbi:haloacid dehalogenase [Pseudomonas oryzihabitans]|nr:haloacid dehalogenase [Pseudomonas psychrotolerans]KTS78878.1 haloacid dehalogenase [Pseudomonas psychrotolerans]KTT09351.1 haloacid dehalogenase [Pseudomonas psychrotolerans]KTT29872.1 haloacid dehalogenase [Pseudomonas psychrotolerans]KTT38055.1 haloacid dehalogenase [Pseudomonas psychrotolerans]